MGNKQEYLARLKLAIEHLHKCDATWRESIHVHEIFAGQTVWKGAVEVFDLTGHPKANHCYGWSHPGGNDVTDERFVAVLEIPPVKSAETAVRASIIADTKKGRNQKS